MNPVLHSIDLGARGSTRIVLLAWLLLVAQLFSHLHAIEHLDGDHPDEHSEEICLVCTLSAGLDAANVVKLGVPAGASGSLQRMRICCTAFALELLTAYQGRAPPKSTSTA